MESLTPEVLERRLSWLRTFRGYTEDEAELAAWAADEIETLEEENKKLKGKYEAAVAIMAGAELLFPGITVRAMERLPKEESH